MLAPGTPPASLHPLACGEWRWKTHVQRDLNQCGTFLMCARCGRGLLGSSACLPGLYPSVCVCVCVCVCVSKLSRPLEFRSSFLVRQGDDVIAGRERNRRPFF